MKRKAKKSRFFILFLLLLIIDSGGYYYYSKIKEEKRIADIKNGWYIEVTTNYINIRDEATVDSVKIGKIKRASL